MRQTAPASTSHDSWLSRREVGTSLGIRFVVWLANTAGRRAVRGVVRIISVYYLLFRRSIRAASRNYLRRCQSEPPSLGLVYRHIFNFAQVTADRVFLLKGRTDLFQYTCTGQDYLDRLAAEKRGAILLGAHFGSFEIMRVLAVAETLQINIVGYFRNAQKINNTLARLSPKMAARVIHIQPGSPGPVLAIKERVEAGEMIAILADRAGLNDRVVHARFFGDLAAFPAGPFVLAGLLRCPVYLTFGPFAQPNRYDLYCEPFAEQLDLPRTNREAALQSYVQQYANRLEHYCRRSPLNWFNFFDFWNASVDTKRVR